MAADPDVQSMTGQHTDAAERSAHVTRGADAPAERVSPCVETPEGYRVRAVVDAEQRCALLAAKLGEVEEERDALRARAERAEAALRAIKSRPEADVMLDPHWPQRIARLILEAIPHAPG